MGEEQLEWIGLMSVACSPAGQLAIAGMHYHITPSQRLRSNGHFDGLVSSFAAYWTAESDELASEFQIDGRVHCRLY
jgi:hypothetical protein